MLYIYDENDLPIGISYRESSYQENEFDSYMLVRNMQGDVIGICNGDGELVAEYTYNAWGECTVTNHTEDNIGNINPFRYRSYYQDSETGFYYLNSRYYDPKVKRFINADDISYMEPMTLSGINLYAYCDNNPAMTKRALYVDNMSSNINDGFSLGNGKAETSRSNGVEIPVWLSSLLTGTDFVASIAPALQTLCQYVKYPEIEDLNKLYGQTCVPSKLNTACKVIGYGLLTVNIGLSALENFTNDSLTLKQQRISFGVDTVYTLATFGIGYGAGAVISSLVPGGVFIAPFVSAGVTFLIEQTNEWWGWLDGIKQWIDNL